MSPRGIAWAGGRLVNQPCKNPGRVDLGHKWHHAISRPRVTASLPVRHSVNTLPAPVSGTRPIGNGWPLALTIDSINGRAIPQSAADPSAARRSGASGRRRPGHRQPTITRCAARRGCVPAPGCSPSAAQANTTIDSAEWDLSGRCQRGGPHTARVAAIQSVRV